MSEPSIRPAFREAAEDARREGRLEPISRLLRAGYEPTGDEWSVLDSWPIGKRDPLVEESLKRKAEAVLRFRQLRRAGIPAAAAKEQAAAEFGIPAYQFRYLAAGKDDRVRAIVAERLENSEAKIRSFPNS